MSVQRVYVGEPGGENLDVARENERKETQAKARFEPGDIVSIPSELAERLDASWATEAKAEAKVQTKDDKEGDSS